MRDTTNSWTNFSLERVSCSNVKGDRQMLTRRSFLKTSSLVALGSTVPAFISRTAAQAPQANLPGARDTILVVVQLTGGNDGPGPVIPFNDPAYARLRPTLRQRANEVVRVNDQIGLHPSMN